MFCQFLPKNKNGGGLWCRRIFDKRKKKKKTFDYENYFIKKENYVPNYNLQMNGVILVDWWLYATMHKKVSICLYCILEIDVIHRKMCVMRTQLS